MFEPVAECSPLPGRVLEDHHRAAPPAGPEGALDRIGNETKRFILRACRARSRMNDHSKEAERVGAIELVDECGDRLLSQHRERRGEINQITGVRDYRVDAGLPDTCAKRADVGPL